MSHLSHATCLRLKELGFPQPRPASGQIWYDTYQNLCVLHNYIQGSDIFEVFIFGTTSVYDTTSFNGWTFCPSLEYITAFLPPGFILEMWDGRHSCKIDDWQNLIRTQADSFSEAAALVWLELNKKQTPVPNIIGAGATSAV